MSETPDRLLWRCLCLVSLCFIAACASAPTATPPPTFWTITTLALEQQMDAPVIWLDAAELASWVGADDAGIHQDARRRRDGLLNAPVVLPLPPRHPYSQRSAAAGAGNFHLFWLDAGDDGANALFSAVLTPDLAIRRGPTPISDRLTLRYSLAALDGGAVWVAWSGGVLSEPAIFMQYVDEDGRPRLSQQAATNADFPALARLNSGGIRLFWLVGGSRRLMRGAWSENRLEQVTVLTAGVAFEPGDRLVSLSAALDRIQGYVFWNLTRADGQDETWLSAGEIDAGTWSPPQRLSVPSETVAPVRWAAPLPGQHDALPVAAQVGNELRVLWFQGGTVVRGETVAPLAADLLAPPGIYSDGARLVVAWSEPTPQGVAALNVAVQP